MYKRQVTMVLKVMMVLQDHKEPRVLKVLKVQQETKVLKEVKVT